MKKEKSENKLIGLYVLFLLIFFIWLLISIIIYIYVPDNEKKTFGDSFGPIDSLFSSLALGGIIYTIYLQKKELSLQREELSETREEFKTQNKTLRLQRFENTFFHLLELHHQIVNNIDLDIYKRKPYNPLSLKSIEKDKNLERDIITLRGRDVFKYSFDQMNYELKKDNIDFNKEYMEYWESVQTDFGHYFRNLYRIIKLVNETEFTPFSELDLMENTLDENIKLEYEISNFNSRYNYTSIVRSQLSDYELIWLFYNGLSDNGIKKLKPLIEKYSLLKNLSKNKINDKNLILRYNKKAFKE